MPTLIGMGIEDVIAGVFGGVVLAAGFLWGIREAARVEKGSDMSWLAIAALLLPLAFLGLSVIAQP